MATGPTNVDVDKGADKVSDGSRVDRGHPWGPPPGGGLTTTFGVQRSRRWSASSPSRISSSPKSNSFAYE